MDKRTRLKLSIFFTVVLSAAAMLFLYPWSPLGQAIPGRAVGLVLAAATVISGLNVTITFFGRRSRPARLALVATIVSASFAVLVLLLAILSRKL